jgi:predicted GIY-YIG superfamily endonuclease
MTIGQLNNLFLTQLEMKHGEGKTKTKFEGDEYYDLAWYLGVDDSINGNEAVYQIKELINNTKKILIANGGIGEFKIGEQNGILEFLMKIVSQ